MAIIIENEDGTTEEIGPEEWAMINNLPVDLRKFRQELAQKIMDEDPKMREYFEEKMKERGDESE